jgi:hypothetical protein
MESYEDVCRRGGDDAIRELDRFFAGTGRVHQTLNRVSRYLCDVKIPYAVAGGLALNAHGFLRATIDVDVLISEQSLTALHANLEREGLASIPGRRNHLRDLETGVRVDFLITGQFPGDGKPKPVAFPDPAKAGIEINGINYLNLESLIELKLASGITNAGRLKDLGDVQELIRTLHLPRDFSLKLNPYVSGKFAELWDGVANASNPNELE